MRKKKYLLLDLNTQLLRFYHFFFGNIILYSFFSKFKKSSYKIARYPKYIPPKQVEVGYFYLLVGVFCYFFLSDIFHSIPTLNALSSIGRLFLIIGLCLILYINYHTKRQKRRLLIFIPVIFVFPFLTIVKDGFLGLGVGIVLTILVFVSNFYRLRIYHIFLVILSLFFALSFYVAYLRDRDDLRHLVWGGASYSDRINRLYDTLANPEFFNPYNTKHLDAINERMNQNHLVGYTIVNISSGRKEYSRGETIKAAILSLVPRFIWKDKPYRAGDDQIVSEYTGIRFSKDVSVGLPQVMEFYINFGIISLISGFIILGIIFRLLERRVAYYLYNNDFKKFVIWFLPSIALLEPGVSIIQNVVSAVSGVVLGYIVYLYPRRLYSRTIVLSIFLFILFLTKSYYIPIINPIYPFVKKIIIILAIVYLSKIVLLPKLITFYRKVNS